MRGFGGQLLRRGAYLAESVLSLRVRDETLRGVGVRLSQTRSIGSLIQRAELLLA